MNYWEMHRRLEAARKEIRANVFILRMIDLVNEKYQKGFEEMIWAGNFRRW